MNSSEFFTTDPSGLLPVYCRFAWSELGQEVSPISIYYLLYLLLIYYTTLRDITFADNLVIVFFSSLSQFDSTLIFFECLFLLRHGSTKTFQVLTNTITNEQTTKRRDTFTSAYSSRSTADPARSKDEESWRERGIIVITLGCVGALLSIRSSLLLSALRESRGEPSLHSPFSSRYLT